MSYDHPVGFDLVSRPSVDVGRLEWSLWIVVLLALVGDVVTTFVGLHLGLSEANPIARGAIDGHGVLGMLALKAFALGVAICGRLVVYDRYGAIVPAGLALPWVIATGINITLIVTVV